MMTTKRERKLRSFEALQIALATDDAKRMRTTPEMERAVDRLYAAGRQRMAEINYAEAVQHPVVIASATVRPSVVAMARDAVKAFLDRLCVKFPDLQVAYRDGESLSDDDLRALLEDALRLTEDKEE